MLEETIDIGNSTDKQRDLLGKNGEYALELHAAVKPELNVLY